jgi:hypothetical protein
MTTTTYRCGPVACLSLWEPWCWQRLRHFLSCAAAARKLPRQVLGLAIPPSRRRLHPRHRMLLLRRLRSSRPRPSYPSLNRRRRSHPRLNHRRPGLPQRRPQRRRPLPITQKRNLKRPRILPPRQQPQAIHLQRLQRPTRNQLRPWRVPRGNLRQRGNRNRRPMMLRIQRRPPLLPGATAKANFLRYARLRLAGTPKLEPTWDWPTTLAGAYRGTYPRPTIGTLWY